jgi:hypothetical protein
MLSREEGNFVREFVLFRKVAGIFCWWEKMEIMWIYGIKRPSSSRADGHPLPHLGGSTIHHVSPLYNIPPP